ncbi:MAG: IMP dehydrogenase [Nanoarchaeota archaeon]|nr:IMP dehydrogenase [Nanoarchaeota archaeon]
MGLDDTLAELMQKDRERLGIVKESGVWTLTGEMQTEADARDSYKLGQLVWLEFLNHQGALSPADIKLVSCYGTHSRSDTDTTTTLGGLKLPFPVLAANMDFVVDAEFAILFGQMGGLAVLHQFGDIETQLREIDAVKSAPTTPLSYRSATSVPATKDGRLLVAAAVPSLNGFSERMPRLLDAGIDMIVIDAPHGLYPGMVERGSETGGAVRLARKYIKDNQLDTLLVVGNVVTAMAAYELLEAGADGIKVGIGPGQQCSTSRETWAGMPMISGIYFVSLVVKYFSSKKAFLVGDGGISNSGIGACYLAAGADALMMGTLLGRTDKSAHFEERRREGIVHVYGSASQYAREQRGCRGAEAPEGLDRWMPILGSTDRVLFDFQGGIRSSMSYAGANVEGRSDIATLRENARFIRQTTNRD